MARGPKPRMDAKRKSVVVRYQESEYEAVKVYAAQMGVTPSELMRKAVKGYLESHNAPTSVTIQDPNQLRIE